MRFCVVKHYLDTDRDGFPHAFHCIRVAQAQKTPERMVLALLHDLVEDCPSTDVLADIQAEFGYNMAMDVLALSRVEGESYGNYINRIIVHSCSQRFEGREDDVLWVKKADLEDNTRLERVDAKAASRFEMYKEAHAKICDALGIDSQLECPQSQSK